MTISGYSNAIVDTMLGWLKGFANWVLRLFNLAGSVSGSPLLWLSQNWLKLLIFFLVLGVVLDRLIWLIRWRPYWVWFRKERIIVNDEKFFASAELDPSADWNSDIEDRWDERDYVVASTVVKRQDGARIKGAVVRDGRRTGAADRGASGKRGRETGRTQEGVKASTKVRRHEDKAAASSDIFGTQLKRTEVADSYEDEVFNVSNLPVSEAYAPQDGEKK